MTEPAAPGGTGMSALHAPAIDLDRLLGASTRWPRSATPAMVAPVGLALTDDDRVGRDLVVGVDGDLGLRVDIDGIGNVVGTWPADRYDPPVMTGQPHRHRRPPAGSTTGTSACWPASRSSRPIAASRASTTRTPAGRRRSSPTRRAAASRPTCSAASSTSAGSPSRTRSTPSAIDGAVLGDELERIGYAGAVAVPGRPPARLRRAAHRAGPGARGRGRSPSARSPGCRASRGRSSPSPASPTTPAPRRWSIATTPATSPPRSRRSCATLAAELGRPQVGTVGRIELHPDLVNVVAARATHHRRPPQHRRGRAAPRPSARLAELRDELATAEGVTIDAPIAGPLRAGRRSTPT